MIEKSIMLHMVGDR